ncbi:hypothetical protein LTR78_000293 [Recurvomyces mirabilis]|uniref:Amine oxidase domain-containing protein n=1 Tax=Recurvomyces mirabilis TaxID=574656 RepID=A0AAE0WWU9_9PEZI|nr:hypothetical protein LTR78_000293 [Recurvomyces mirabilis]KAK5161948.1 hypothetical protein LTS14_000294 [Recurvomyces mirabilis]
MPSRPLSLLSLTAFSLHTLALACTIPRSNSVSFQSDIKAEAGGAHNVHLTYNAPLSGGLSLHYGGCDILASSDCHHTLGQTHIGDHPLAKRHVDHPEQRPRRFVWLPPSDVQSGGCLHAFSGGALVGRSNPVTIVRRNERRWIAASEVMDWQGPWFDGVEYLKEKEPEDVFVAKAKSQKIGIIGGGMSGLMTSHLLTSVGFHDWTIIEASHRIGGRVHTSYLNGTKPEDYQYQEMGPMRFPVEITQGNETIPINDHRMVFQLADEMNKLNGNDSEFGVNFIPWIQNSPNLPASTSKRRPDGTVPSVTEVKNDPADYAVNANLTYSNATAVALATEGYEDWKSSVSVKETAINVFEAHKKAIADGLFDYSEAGYINYVLGYSKNTTDQIDSFQDVSPSWDYDTGYFSATKWRTIDKGLSRLPASFIPHVLNRTYLNTTVQGLHWNDSIRKMSVQYRNQSLFAIEPESMDFDYTIVAVPFSRVRLWRLPAYTSLLSRAISQLNYEQSCKVALHYQTRFWEHLPKPILGGCGSTDISNIGSICYPSYKQNSTGPGVLLASYSSGVSARSLGSMTEAQHVAYVQRAMIEVHGPLAETEFTGAHDRICWEANEFQAGAWASPMVGQQDLYLPAYFHTEKQTVFVGEHTSYTHAWIWSALESAVRGTTQMLLDMGLVDEAKEITGFWMARWIRV